MLKNKYLIENNGPLMGEVKIEGAKNSALALIAASVMCNDIIVLENIPNVSDVHNLLNTMEYLGSKIDFNIKTHTLILDNRNIDYSLTLDIEFIQKIRASYYLLGALLGRYKEANVSLPGGCNIGTRPMDLHLKGFEKLGAIIALKEGNICAKANKLIGTTIYLDFASVGATINIMLAAVFAEGTTTILNAAKEPHVIDVALFLNKMGAKIRNADTGKIIINGVDKLHSTTYETIPDQIEAGTFLLAGAITNGNVTIQNIIPKHMDCITFKLKEMGCIITEDISNINITTPSEKFKFHPVKITTSPYPGFPTDMQPQFAVALGLAQGTSVINETIFENRFLYADEMARMGADMYVYRSLNIIGGVEYYQGAKINTPDLRAGAALTLAGLVAKNKTTLDNIHYIQRGYENFDEKLNSLGANIKIID